MSSKNASNGQLGWPWMFSWPMANGGLPSVSFAPERLWQPINPGWTFGNVTINSSNSSAPELEQAIVSRHSYGRQIGRLVEVVEALLDAMPAVKKSEQAQDFIKLADELRQIRSDTRQTRLDKLRDELRELKDQDETAWRDLMKSAR